MKREIKRRIREEIITEYPIEGLIAGWYFRIGETSPAAWLAEGTDEWGRSVSCQGSDPDALIKKCAAMAKDLVSRGLEDGGQITRHLC